MVLSMALDLELLLSEPLVALVLAHRALVLHSSLATTSPPNRYNLFHSTCHLWQEIFLVWLI